MNEFFKECYADKLKELIGGAGLIRLLNGKSSIEVNKKGHFYLSSYKDGVETRYRLGRIYE